MPITQKKSFRFMGSKNLVEAKDKSIHLRLAVLVFDLAKFTQLYTMTKRW